MSTPMDLSELETIYHEAMDQTLNSLQEFLLLAQRLETQIHDAHCYPAERRQMAATLWQIKSAGTKIRARLHAFSSTMEDFIEEPEI